MIKYYHELTSREFNKIIKDNPGKMWAWMQENYPQPEWCKYQDAVAGGPFMGCVGLVDFAVHKQGKAYCVSCEFNKDAENGG